jgi:hypothetical protein
MRILGVAFYMSLSFFFKKIKFFFNAFDSMMKLEKI